MQRQFFGFRVIAKDELAVWENAGCCSWSHLNLCSVKSEEALEKKPFFDIGSAAGRRVVHKQAARSPARVFCRVSYYHRILSKSRANSGLHGAIMEPTTPPVGTAVNRRLAFNSSLELSQVQLSQVQSLPPHLLKKEGWYIHFFTLDSSTKRLSCRICMQTCPPSLQRPSRTFAKDSRHSMRNHIVSVHPEYDGLFD